MTTGCHNCISLRASVERGEESSATCGDCGTQFARKRAPRAWSPKALRDMPALAAISPIRAIDLDPASKAHGADEPEDLDATVRAERSRLNGRMAARRLAAMREHSPEGARYARALWLAYGLRGPEVNSRESVAVLVASACLEWTEGDWSVVCRERAQINERAQARKLTVPDVPRLVATILGNAILGCAVSAYEQDTWEDWRPRASSDPVLDEPARVRRVKEWRARFDARGTQSDGS